MDGKIAHRIPLALPADQPFPAQFRQQRIGAGLLHGFEYLLPQFSRLHACMEGVLLVISCKLVFNGGCYRIQHGGGHIPAGQRFHDLSLLQQRCKFLFQRFFVLLQFGRQFFLIRQGQSHLPQQLQHLIPLRTAFLDLQSFQHGGHITLMPPGHIVQNHPSANSFQRRVETNNKSVPVLTGNILCQAQLGIPRFSRLQFVPVQQHHLAQQHHGAMIQMYLHIVGNDPLGIRKIGKLYIQHPGNRYRTGFGYSISPLHIALFQSAQVHCYPLACIGCLHTLTVHLQIPNPGGRP